MENVFWKRCATAGAPRASGAKLLGMRWSLTILLAAGLAAGAGPRWLRFPDKGVQEPPRNTRAWQDAPMRADLLDSLKRIGWKIRSQYRWENLVSAEQPAVGIRLPTGVVDAGAVAVAHRPATPVVVAPRAAPRTANVDEYTILLRKIWNTLGIDAAQVFRIEHDRSRPGKSEYGQALERHTIYQGARCFVRVTVDAGCARRHAEVLCVQSVTVVDFRADVLGEIEAIPRQNAATIGSVLLDSVMGRLFGKAT